MPVGIERNVFTFNLLLYKANLCVAAASVFLFLVGMGLYLARPEKISLSSQKSQIETKTLDLSSIGEGPLSLLGECLNKTARDIKSDLLFLGAYPSSTHSSKENTMVVGLKFLEGGKTVSPEQKMFLDYRPAETTKTKRVLFSQTATPYFLKLKETRDGKLFAEVFENGAKVGSFITYKSSSSGKQAEEMLLQSEPFSVLRSAKLWGTDKLLQQYGGEEFTYKKTKSKIEFQKENAPYFLYLGEGDSIVFAENHWRIPTSSQDFDRFPFARVRTIGEHYLEFEVWKEKEMFPGSLKIHLQPAQRIPLKFEEIFTSVRMKTASQLSCLLGKKRVLMKKGDWWVKTGSSWHSVKSREEMEDILSHRCLGELFIFDGIEKSEGRTLVTGHFFDTMRTGSQPVSFSLPEKRLQGKGGGFSEKPKSSFKKKRKEKRNDFYGEDSLENNTQERLP